MVVKKTAILETGDRILQLLECFNLTKPEWGVTELSKKLDLNKSVIHRMLVTLEKRGYVTQNPVTKKYSLGLKLFELGMIVAEQMNLRTVAKPIMEELAYKTGETVILEVVDGLEGLCIEKVESSQSMKCTSQVGKRVPLYAGAPTKSLMAYLPEEKISKIIERGMQNLTKYTVTDRDELLEQLKTICKQGYCITYGEVDLGSMGISFPIRNYEGKVIASLSLVGPEFRMADKTEQLLMLCKNAAETISQRLGAK